MIVLFEWFFMIADDDDTPSVSSLVTLTLVPRRSCPWAAVNVHFFNPLHSLFCCRKGQALTIPFFYSPLVTFSSLRLIKSLEFVFITKNRLLGAILSR